MIKFTTKQMELEYAKTKRRELEIVAPVSFVSKLVGFNADFDESVKIVKEMFDLPQYAATWLIQFIDNHGNGTDRYIHPEFQSVETHDDVTEIVMAFLSLRRGLWNPDALEYTFTIEWVETKTIKYVGIESVVSHAYRRCPND